MTKAHCAPARRRALLFSCSLGLAAPALADHPAGGNGTLTGVGMLVGGPDTLGAGTIAAGLRLAYVHPERRSDRTLENLAGAHIHGHASDYSLRSSAGLAYGLTDRLTVTFDLPFLHHENIREGAHSHHGGSAHNSAVERGDVSGVGDATAMGKYRLVGAGESGIALLAGIKLPTGSTRKRDEDGERFETEHQPGSGSWDPIVGLSAGTPLGPLQVNASAIYQGAGKGAQATRLGDRAQGGIALIRRFEGPDHHAEGDDQRHGHQSWDALVELTGEWEGRQRIVGKIEEYSGGRAILLSPGARFNSASGWSAAASVGLPLWQRVRVSHPDNGYRLTFAVGRSF